VTLSGFTAASETSTSLTSDSFKVVYNGELLQTISYSSGTIVA
jgi:hypothetical protein